MSTTPLQRLELAARSASCLAFPGRARVIRLTAHGFVSPPASPVCRAHAALLHLASCVRARRPPGTTLGGTLLMAGSATAPSARPQGGGPVHGSGLGRPG